MSPRRRESSGDLADWQGVDMVEGIRPTTCMAHLVIDGEMPCRNINVGADPLSTRPFLLCEYHMWRIGMRAKRKPRQRVEVKVRRRTIRNVESERLQREVDTHKATIASLRSQLAELYQEDKPTRKVAVDGTVYFLRIGGYIKIGWTSDMTRRMKSYPPDTTLLATMPGTRKDELREHKRFAHLRTHGREWYPLAPQITERVAAVVREQGEPDEVTFAAKPVIPAGSNTKQYLRPKSWRG